MKKCPKCSSSDVKLVKYLGINITKCNNCGFDEGSVYDVYPEQKASQKAKGQFTSYKTGGSQRTRKKK